MTPTNRCLLLPVAVVLLTACPKPSPETPVEVSEAPGAGGLPSAAQVTQLAALQVSEGTVEPVADVSSWTVASTHATSTHWDALAPDRVRPDMHCVAEELGRFREAHGARPPVDIERFILAACGSPAIRVDRRFIQLQITGDVSDEKLDAAASGHVQGVVDELVAQTPDALGFWMAQSDGDLVIAVAAGHDMADGFEVTAAGSDTQIRGTLRRESRQVSAWVTGEGLEVAACSTDGALPAFEITCSAAEGARIEVVSYGPDSYLATPVVWAAAPGTRTYERPRVRASTLQALNEQRSTPLTEAPAQTETLQPLARVLAAARVSGREDLIDQVHAATMAGWDVEGYLASGDYVSLWPLPGDDWLAATLAWPRARHILLDPTATRAALAVTPTSNGGAALIGIYRLAAPAPAETIARIRDELTAAREDGLHRLPEAQRHLERAVASIESGDLTPNEAAEKTSRGLGAVKTAKGNYEPWTYFMESHSLTEIPFSDRVLTDPNLSAEVAVARYQRPDEPWIRWVVLVAGRIKSPE